MAPKNGFIRFVFDKKRETPEWKDKSLQELVELCGPLWMNLDLTERKMYGKCPSSPGQQEKAPELSFDSSKKIQNLKKMPVFGYKRDQLFCLMHANVFCVTRERQVVPAEIGFCLFSLERGIVKTFHDFIEPGVIPVAYKYLCQEVGNRTHKIPADLVHLNPNYTEIVTNINSIFHQLRESGENGPELKVFTLPSLIDQSQLVLKWLYSKCSLEEPKILFLDIIEFFTSSHILSQQDVLDLSMDGSVAEERLTGDSFLYDMDTSCHYHYDIGVPYCSLAFCKKWCYVMLDHFCPKHKIEMIPGKHKPPVAIDPSKGLPYGAQSTKCTKDDDTESEFSTIYSSNRSSMPSTTTSVQDHDLSIKQTAFDLLEERPSGSRNESLVDETSRSRTDDFSETASVVSTGSDLGAFGGLSEREQAIRKILDRLIKDQAEQTTVTDGQGPVAEKMPVRPNENAVAAVPRLTNYQAVQVKESETRLPGNTSKKRLETILALRARQKETVETSSECGSATSSGFDSNYARAREDVIRRLKEIRLQRERREGKSK